MCDFNELDKNMPILVVDDFQTMRRLMKNCLISLGFKNIEEAEDGKIAFDKLKTNKFEFVISDWSMPNMMGIELLQALRDDEGLKKIPFMMVTAESQKDSVIEVASEEHTTNYIVKPFTASILQQKMEAIFKD